MLDADEDETVVSTSSSVLDLGQIMEDAVEMYGYKPNSIKKHIREKHKVKRKVSILKRHYNKHCPGKAQEKKEAAKHYWKTVIPKEVQEEYIKDDWSEVPFEVTEAVYEKIQAHFPKHKNEHDLAYLRRFLKDKRCDFTHSVIARHLKKIWKRLPRVYKEWDRVRIIKNFVDDNSDLLLALDAAHGLIRHANKAEGKGSSSPLSVKPGTDAFRELLERQMLKVIGYSSEQFNDALIAPEDNVSKSAGWEHFLPPITVFSQKKQHEAYDKRWAEMFAELVAYKTEHGHCNVPQQRFVPILICLVCVLYRFNTNFYVSFHFVS